MALEEPFRLVIRVNQVRLKLKPGLAHPHAKAQAVRAKRHERAHGAVRVQKVTRAVRRAARQHGLDGLPRHRRRRRGLAAVQKPVHVRVFAFGPLHQRLFLLFFRFGIFLGVLLGSLVSLRIGLLRGVHLGSGRRSLIRGRRLGSLERRSLDSVRHFRDDFGMRLRRRGSRLDAVRFVRHRRDGSVRRVRLDGFRCQGRQLQVGLGVRGRRRRRFRRRFCRLGLHGEGALRGGRPATHPRELGAARLETVARDSPELGSACRNEHVAELKFCGRKRETEFRCRLVSWKRALPPRCPSLRHARSPPLTRAPDPRARACLEGPHRAPTPRWASRKLV